MKMMSIYKVADFRLIDNVKPSLLEGFIRFDHKIS